MTDLAFAPAVALSTLFGGWLVLGLVRFRSGNRLHHVAAQGYDAVAEQGRATRRLLTKAILDEVPEESVHKKFSTARVLAVLLRGGLSRDSGSMEQAVYDLELERLKRIGHAISVKGFPESDTSLLRLRHWLAGHVRALTEALVAASIRFAARHTNQLTELHDAAFDVHKEPAFPRKKAAPVKHPGFRFLDPRQREAIEADDYRRDLIGCKDFRGTKLCFANASLMTTSPHRYTLANINMRDCNNRFHDALDWCLTEAADRGVTLGTLFIDREASNGVVLRVANRHRDQGTTLDYSIAAKQDALVKRLLQRVKWQGLPHKFGWDWFYVPNVSVAPGVVSNLAGVRHLVEERDASANDGVRHEYKTFLWWTTFEVRAENAYEKSEEYRGRWGIETGNRQTRHMFPPTQSTSRGVRRFLYSLRLMHLNLWKAFSHPSLREGLPDVPPGRAPSVTQVRRILFTALDEWPDPGPPFAAVVPAAVGAAT